MLPYDRTRVALQTGTGGDYVNASLIYSEERESPAWAFISAQGPLPETVEDHWRIVLENQVGRHCQGIPTFVRLLRLG